MSVSEIEKSDSEPYEDSGDEYQPDGNDSDSDCELLKNRKKPVRNCKRKREKTSNESRKGARKRTRTDRYGKRESTINYNSFFENLSKEKTPPQASLCRKGGETFSKFIENNGTDSFVSRIVDSHFESNINDDESEPSVGITNTFETNQSIFTETRDSPQSTNGGTPIPMLIEMMWLVKGIETKFDANIKSFQQQIARIEVMLKNRRSSVDSDEINFETQYFDELRSMGFPLMEPSSLTELENKLNDESYENKLVSIESISLYFINI